MKTKAIDPGAETKTGIAVAAEPFYKSPEAAGMTLHRETVSDKRGDEYLATKDIVISAPDGRQIVVARKGQIYNRTQLAHFGIGSLQIDPNWRI